MGSRYDHLNREELLRLLEARDQRDATRFGLVWEANEIERDKALNNDFVALDLVREQCVGAAPWRNLIIEGDNFDALRYLRMTFAGQVKCILIDPPYNTGNKDFVYNDSYVDREDSWRHSKWCEFMSQRLKLAKDLLREDGIIFVSIDDNELFSLGLLMNRIFGEKNFLAQFVWQKAYSPRMDAKVVSWDHDSIVAFGGGQNAGFKRIAFEQDASAFKNVDEATGRRYRKRQWRKEGSGARRQDRPNLYYGLTAPDGVTIYPIRPDGSEGRWRGNREYFSSLVAAGEIEWVKSADTWQVYVKQFADDEATRPPSTWWTSDEAGHNHEAAEEIREIFGTPVFQTPKPTRLLERLISLVANEDDIILDFFAGSGTTAHAVHKLNVGDGGRRRCILVSSTEATASEPDKNVCRDICAERVRRVIKGFTPKNGEAVAGLGGDFAYLRTHRIQSGRLLEIEHAQVWTALQLAHLDSFTAYEDGPFLWAGNEESAICYIPRFRREFAAALRRKVKESAAVAVYSWQPQTLKQHVRDSHVTHLSVSDTLMRRFGLNLTLTPA